MQSEHYHDVWRGQCSNKRPNLPPAKAWAHASSPLHSQEVTGHVFAYDKHTNCVIIKQVGSHGGVNNLRFLKTNYIKVGRDLCTRRAVVGPQCRPMRARG